MNQAEVLCHSSGPWKKHKYFQKIGEGANAVYKYARNKVTGEGYKENAASWEATAKQEDERAKYLKKEIYDPAYEEGDEDWKRLSKIAMRGANSNALEYRKIAAGYREDYRTKSLKGVTESAISRGQSIIDNLFGKGTEKRTIRDTMTGKTRTPSAPKSKSDTINIKELSKKNKRFK